MNRLLGRKLIVWSWFVESAGKHKVIENPILWRADCIDPFRKDEKAGIQSRGEVQIALAYRSSIRNETALAVK